MISLILSTYKSDDALHAILKALLSQSYDKFEIIIAEDAQEKSTQRLIEEFSTLQNCTLVHMNQKDKGFRKCRILNRAIHSAKGDYIVFLDGDCLPHHHLVADHMELAENGFLVQGRRAFIRESAVPQVLRHGLSLPLCILKNQMYGLAKAFRWPKAKLQINTDLNKTLGCNLGVWKSDLLEINGFDEDYEGWGREDSDLVARLYHKGLKRKLVHGRAIVYHLDHPIQSRDQLTKNDNRLNEVLSKKKIRCSNGIIKE